jgi:hypothetical protein
VAEEPSAMCSVTGAVVATTSANSLPSSPSSWIVAVTTAVASDDESLSTVTAMSTVAWSELTSGVVIRVPHWAT